MKPVTSFPTRDALMQAAAERIADALRRGITERGKACAALSGGGTPEPAYRLLAAMPLDWPRVTFLLVDERFVPPVDEASNEGMLRRALAPALSAGAKLMPMFAESESLEEAANRAEGRYAHNNIDIAVMGMGGDGHTASWFPQSPELASALALNNPRAVIAVTAAGAAGSPERLTLTRSALGRSESLVLLITGAEKRALLTDEQRARLPVDSLFDLPSPIEIVWAP